jgi:drug/metabolite transporter (DMT)-like permease
MASLVVGNEVARRRATLVGFGAIGLWALLAPLGVLTTEIPPFLLTGLAFGLAALLGLVVQLIRGRPLSACITVPPAAWLLGVGAYFGYHALYFTSLRLLPPVEALLIINLWPLLIVLLSALLAGERLLPRHVIGALAGLAGTTLIVLARAAGDGAPRLPLGYVTALACALIWSLYSVLNRRVAANASSEAVIGFCLATAVLALLASSLMESVHWPEAASWIALVLMGLGPVGAAFFLWDFGTKHGDLRVLGSSAYAAPLIGAVLLILMGHGEPSFHLLLAALLIIGGAALASGELFRKGA